MKTFIRSNWFNIQNMTEHQSTSKLAVRGVGEHLLYGSFSVKDLGYFTRRI